MLFQVVHILVTMLQKVNDSIVKGENIQYVMPYGPFFL